MKSDRINLGRRKQDGTPKCQINLKNRKAAATDITDAQYDQIAKAINDVFVEPLRTSQPT